MKQNELDLGLEVQEHREEQKKRMDTMTYKAINIALEILSEKALLILTTLIAAGFFAWALWISDGTRTFTACLFTVLVFWPILVRYMRKK